jgi:hypothetical protein
MTADAFSSFIGMTLQATGNNNNDWHHVVVRSPATRAAQFIMRRYRVEPHVAETITMVAGLGVGEER